MRSRWIGALVLLVVVAVSRSMVGAGAEQPRGTPAASPSADRLPIAEAPLGLGNGSLPADEAVIEQLPPVCKAAGGAGRPGGGPRCAA